MTPVVLVQTLRDTPPPEIPARPPGESLIRVIIDIILEMLGIEPRLRDGLRALFGRNLSAQFNALAKAVADRDFALVARRAERTFVAMFGKQMLAEFATIVGEDGLKRMLSIVAARLVPFIGWALWIGSFMLAVYKNWSRLQEAHFP